MNNYNLHRFIDAQENTYSIAMNELLKGKKRSHWMWYIFPQIHGLGLSSTSIYYSIKNINEAEAFLKHPVLGERLINICNVLLQLQTNDPHQIFGSPDNMKLQSSMTLFSLAHNSDPVFEKILKKYFNGEKDPATLSILNIRK